MALMVEIKVIPQSGRSGLFVDKSGILKCYLKTAPEKGKANKELVEQIAKFLGLLYGSIQIVSGGSSRKKLVKIETTMSYQDILQKLQSGVQKKLW